MNRRLSSKSASVSPGNPGHHIRADGRIRHQRPRLEDAVRVVPRPVLAVHAAQNPIRAGLQRRMHVLGDARRLGHQAQQVVGEIHRFHRAQPQPFHFGFGQQQPEQVRQAQGTTRFPAPSPQVDAAQHDLAIPLGEPAHLRHHLPGRRAAAAPAHERNDAERAAVVAPVLDLEVGPRAVPGRVFHRRGEKIVLRENVAHVDVAVVGRATPETVTNSAICVLCEFPTTHSTPASDANSSGARCA